MEIAIGLLGLALTTLGVVFAYIWRSNGLLQRAMMTALERIEQGQLEIAASHREIAAGQLEIAASQREIAGGQREIVASQREIAAGQREIAELVHQNRQVVHQLLEDGRQTREALRVAMEGILELLRRTSAPA